MKGFKKRKQTQEVRYVKTPTSQVTRQTRRVGGDLVDKLRASFDGQGQALFSSLGRLVDSPFNSIMTIIVLAITISLASGFYLLINNLHQLTANIQTSAQMSLFLKDEVTDAHADKLANSIRQNPAIQRVNVISKDQALAEFKTYSGFGSAITALKTNPLPVVVQVLPKNTLEDKKELENLRQEFQRFVEVDIAVMDMQWIERLQSIMAVAERGASLLNIMLGFAVLFIAGNTIRQELHNRHEEVIIAKLVGATNAFIQKPFLYTGLWMGLFAGLLAWFIVSIMMLLLRQPVETLSGLYGGNFHLLFFSVTDFFKLVSISSALGGLGSWAVLSYQLQRTQPE
ncbi:MAG: permease-like cell division protein FtsX [Methylovulum sp.]|nr:permease-like cell division protein FtsX [Methylovulum sp.]